MNTYQQIAAVARTTGFKIRCGLLEEVGAVQIEDDRILVQVNRVHCQSQTMGLKVLKRGATVYEFIRVSGVWTRREPITVWWSTDEFHTSVHRPEPAEIEQRRDWEEMCHRPGTGSDPRDNSDRIRQGY